MMDCDVKRRCGGGMRNCGVKRWCDSLLLDESSLRGVPDRCLTDRGSGTDDRLASPSVVIPRRLPDADRVRRVWKVINW